MNTDIRSTHPTIMRLFDEGFEATILSVQEDGWGEYIAYITLYGVNIVYSRDDQGFESLSVYSDEELQNLINVYTEPSDDDFFG